MALGGYPEHTQPEDVLAAARRAARQAGMTLGEWLDAEARRNPLSERRDEGSIGELQERLDAMEQRPGPGRREESTGDLVKRIEERLMAISQHMEDRAPDAPRREEPARRNHTVSRAEAWRAPPPRDFGSRGSRIGGERGRELRDTIAEISTRQSTLEHEFDTTVSSYADRVDHRIDAMEERLERTLEAASPAKAIRDIEAEVRAIAARLDRDRSGPATDLREEMIDLVRRLDELPARLAEDIAPRLEDTARRLDTAARSELDSIRAEMREIAQEMDRGHAARFEALQGDISRLTESMTGEMQLAEADRAQITAIRDDIRELTTKVGGVNRDEFAALREDLRQLSERVDGVPSERLHELDRYLSALAERLEAEPAPAGEGASAGLAEIERRIGLLAAQLETPAPATADLSGIDSQLGELMRRLDEDRSSAELLAALKDEFGELRQKMAGAEDRNQNTLAAVNDTLSRIVDRLTDLESEVEEVSEERRRGAAALPLDEGEVIEPELDPNDLVGRIEAVTRSFDREPDDNTPLAPGSGPPRGAGPDSEQTAEPDEPPAPDLQDHRGDRASFIAAARRAAQAASAETAATPKADPADRAAPSAAGTVGPLGKHKRLLLIGAAMTCLVLGSVILARYLDSSTEVSSLDAAPAAVEVTEAQQPTEESVEAPAETPRVVVTAEPKRPTGTQTETPETAAEAEEPLTTGSISTEPDDAVTEPARTTDMPPEEIGSEKLRRAAAAGDPAAQYEIGARYTDGQGVAQDFSRAVHWYRLAAAQGMAPAQYRLGSLYEKGHGVTRDLAMARMWYQRAAEQGHRTAMHNLAVLHADGIEGKPDYETAAMWFREASEFGLRDSQYNLAVLYARGLGVERDYGESYRWFSIAADQGDAEAAAKRDEIGGQMDETTLSEVRLALESWQPKPLIEEANRVSAPEGGWDDAPRTAAATDPASMVQNAQTLLDRLGYDPGPADGRPGERTSEAIRSFERDTGLPETGEVTPELLDELNRASG